MTSEGLENLENELNTKLTITRKEIADKIEEATKQGDLSENASYTSVLEEQRMNESRIEELSDLVKNAQVMKSSGRNHKVELGESVELEEQGKKKKLEIRIVGDDEADPINGKVSVNSPIGSAILHKSMSDIVTVNTPSGQKTYKIINIG